MASMLARLSRGGLRAAKPVVFRPNVAVRPLSTVKDTTGLAGLPVIENSREVLIALYQKTLEDVEASIPKEAAYYDVVTKLTQHRLDICDSTESIYEIEDKIGTGEIEELIDEAEDELKVVGMMKDWKPWDEKDTHWEVPAEWDAPENLYNNPAATAQGLQPTKDLK
mmetsp:Transcript_8125/g.15073  ORF Transcript_8125/g.15073 Transcript_8125/m.15073 type:complete len:167 (-) Transcript_8125:148-648(-)